MLGDVGRSVDDVIGVIGHAKLEESDLVPISQVISFSPHLTGQDVVLVEVPKDVAEEVAAGGTMVMRGREEDNTVMCTHNRTFDVKGAETSNSMLLVPELSLPADIAGTGGTCLDGRQLQWRTVTGVSYNYLEISRCRPRVRRLRETLSNRTYTETTSREGGDGVRLSELLETIQASEEELRKGLSDVEGVEVAGMWYKLDTDYKMNILNYILRFFDENSWNLDCVKKKETVEALKDLVPDSLVSQVFDIYCDIMDGGDGDEYLVNNDKVCRFYGDYLLSSASSFNLAEFSTMWQEAVPTGLKTNIGQLDGLVIVDSDAGTVKRFLEADLPDNIQERLSVLFQSRERWTVSEITPFVKELSTEKLNVNALLTKYARPVTVAGVKYFCAKHGK